ncbi:MAG: alanine racemase [Clostridia bacterium]|nr:alanine racemase [Clostridia bacterium]
MNTRGVATISKSALRHNFRLLSAHASHEGKKGELWCVVKSDGYGHGLVPVAKALHEAGARQFAVADIDEAETLKDSLPHARVLIFGMTSPAQAKRLQKNGILQSVHSLAYAKALSQATSEDINIHIKIDCGMGRMGLSPLLAEEEVAYIAGLPHLKIQGIYSHLPDADLPKSPRTLPQIQQFHDIVRHIYGLGISAPTHLCATAGILRFGTAGCDGGRVGIGLYGISPSNEVICTALRPALSLTAPIWQIKTIAPGEAVGYGGTWRAPCLTRVAVVPFGYRDGLPRLCQGAKVKVFGHSRPIVGRVSMDLCVVDIGTIPAKEGDSVTIYDRKGLQLATLAERGQTIPYELLSRLSSRVKRQYLE